MGFVGFALYIEGLRKKSIMYFECRRIFGFLLFITVTNPKPRS